MKVYRPRVFIRSDSVWNGCTGLMVDVIVCRNEVQVLMDNSNMVLPFTPIEVVVI